MERLPSPAASQSSAGTSSLASKAQQPTYTTAGTIYNPSSSQPLQAPTRRGRPFKWTGANANQSELSPFPRTLLSALPVIRGTSRGQAYPAIQRYSPLQQNYDRAINPFSRTVQYVKDLEFEMATRQKSGAASAPLPSLFTDIDALEAPESSPSMSDDGEQDEAVQKTLLTTLTVKSLQNLASYPNPNQKNAQKALLRGSKPRSSINSDQHLANTGDLSSHTISNYSKELHNDVGFYKSEQSQIDRHHQLKSPHLDTKYSTAATSTGLFGQPKSGTEHYSTFGSSSVIGTKPLAAGPPGQRQQATYFGSTITPLTKKDRYLSEDEELLSLATRSLSQIGLEDIPAGSGGLESIPRTKQISYEGTYSQLFSGSQVLPPAGQSSANFGTVGLTNRGEAISSAADTFLYTGWQTSNGNVTDHDDDVGEERFKARNDRINYFWYSGINEIDRVLEDEVDKGGHQLSFHGVIGDHRPSGERKKAYSPMEVSEVNNSNISMHSGELLKMASASLSLTKYLRESKRRAAALQTVQDAALDFGVAC